MAGYDALPLISIAVLLIIGLMLVIRFRSKFGWLIVAAAVVWGYKSVQPVIDIARPGSSVPAPDERRGYYRDPAGL
jgi:hypothetical protein